MLLPANRPMENIFQRKYRLATDILSDVADCAHGRLILVGGTALALFYLEHRVSVDLDFVPVSGDDAKEKEALKGCLSKKGYRTQRARFSNQFIVQSESTSVKVEVFTPEEKVRKTEKRILGGRELMVASLDDLLRMKAEAYSNRRKSRDLFDVVAILQKEGRDLSLAEKLIAEHGRPDDSGELEQMDPDEAVLSSFRKVLA